jgi:hypothetical protein
MSRLSAIAVLGFLVASLSADEPLPVFVLAGTSNMTGGGARVADLTDEQRLPQKDVLIFQGGSWVPLEAGKAPSRGNNVGIELGFGQTMAKHLGKQVGIITGPMRTASPDESGYASIVRSVQAAQKSRPIVVVGMAVQLYEVDSRTEEGAKAFGQNLTKYIESARRDFGNEKLVFAKNKALAPRTDGTPADVQTLPAGGFPHLEIIRAAETSLQLPGFGLTKLDDLSRGRDNVHYDTKGILELGKRHAETIIGLMKSQLQEKSP